MIELPEALQEHLDRGVTTLCYAWIVERTDGTKLGFTDHDKQFEIESTICEPTSGFTAGALESSLGLSGDTSQIDGALSSDALNEKDIVAGFYDAARIYQYLVNWQDTSCFGLLRKYHVGEIVREDEAFRVELRSFSSQLDQIQGRQYLRKCDAMLGDQRCGFDLDQAGFRTTGVVVADELLSNQTIPMSLLAEYTDGWFAGGKLQLLSGELSGRSFEIADLQWNESASFGLATLVQPMPVVPDEGTTIELTAGCDKSFHCCKNKFGNPLNFRGFPHMPGNDTALTYVDDEMQFNGEPLVP